LQSAFIKLLDIQPQRIPSVYSSFFPTNSLVQEYLVEKALNQKHGKD